MAQRNQNRNRPEMMSATYESAKAYVETYEAWRGTYDEADPQASSDELVEALEKMLNLAATCAFHLRRNPGDKKKVERAIKQARRATHA